METRLVAYAPLGDRIGVVPDALAYTFAAPLGDMATIEATYPEAGRRADALEGPVEVAVEVWDGSAWFEPLNARQHILRRSWNRADEARTRTYSGLGIQWLARRARVWDDGPLDSDGKRQFLSSNPGQIIGAIFVAAQGRGWGPGLSIDFTTATDSAGQPWDKIITIAYDPGLDLDAVMSNLVDQGMIDYAWQGRTLRVWNADTALGRDHATGDAPVWIRDAHGVTSTPEESSAEDLVTMARVQGDEGRTWTFNNPAALDAYGRLEGYVTQGGVSDEGTASLLADATLRAGENVREQITREFHAAGANVLPWTDYRLGDWVLVDRDHGPERVRVQGITLTRDADGVRGHITLGTRLEDLLSRLTKRTKGIVGGSTADGGSGARPSPPPVDIDNARPAAPTGLVLQGDVYFDEDGFAHARVAADWADVTEDTMGRPVDVEAYEVWVTQDDTMLTRLAATVDDSEASVSPLETGVPYSFRVRAVSDSGTPGDYSGPVPIMTGSDTTPPPPPSTPILTSRLGTVTVAWDGLDETASGMPVDFNRIEVFLADEGGIGTLRGSTERDSILVAHGLPTDPEAAAEFWFVAVDHTGNRSAPSASGFIVPERIKGDDLEAHSVTTNALAAGAIDGMVITGALFQTDTEHDAGIKIDENGFRVFRKVPGYYLPVEYAFQSTHSLGKVNGWAEPIPPPVDVGWSRRITLDIEAYWQSGDASYEQPAGYLGVGNDDHYTIYLTRVGNFHAIGVHGAEGRQTYASSTAQWIPDTPTYYANYRFVVEADGTLLAYINTELVGTYITATPPTGPGLQMTMDNLGLWYAGVDGNVTLTRQGFEDTEADVPGTEVVTITDTGDVSITGIYRNAVDGERIEIPAGDSKVNLVSQWGHFKPGWVGAGGLGFGTDPTLYGVELRSPDWGDGHIARVMSEAGPDWSEVTVMADAINLTSGIAHAGFDADVWADNLRTDTLEVGSTIKTGTVVIQGAYVYSETGSLILRAAGSMGLRAGGSTTNSILLSTDGSVSTGASLRVGNQLDVANMTNGNGPNVTFNENNGRLRVVGSSRRFKDNIRDADGFDADAVLALVPRQYERNDIEGEPDLHEVGFIAEEAAELGLEEWVFRDRDGVPYSFDYSRWSVALQVAVRELRDRIAALEERNGA